MARNLDSTRSRERIFRPSDDLTQFEYYTDFVLDKLIEGRKACHDPLKAKKVRVGTWWSATSESSDLDRVTYRSDDTCQPGRTGWAWLYHHLRDHW